MANVVYAPNQFNPNDGRIFTQVCEGTTIGDILKQYEGKGVELEAIINGKRHSNLNYKVQKEDHITIAVKVAGGGGGSKGILRIVAMIVVLVVSIYAGPLVGGALKAGLGLALTATQATMLGTSLIMIAGTLAVNALIKTPMQGNAVIGGESLADGNTYGWDPATNQVTEGNVACVLYGKTKITPLIISQYRSYVENKDIINVLFHLTDGETNTVQDIEINNIPIAEVSDITPLHIKGDIVQSAIADFSDAIYEIPVSQELTDVGSTITIRTNGNAVTKLAVGMVIPGGLYTYAQGYGELYTGYSIEYKRVGYGVWDLFTGSTDTHVRNVYGSYQKESGRYYNSEVKYYTANSAGDTDPNKSYQMYNSFVSAQAADPNGTVFPEYVWVEDWHDVTEVRTEGYGFYHSAKTPDTLKFRHVMDVQIAGQYDVRITRLVAFPLISGQTSYANRLGVTFIQEITEGIFTYPYTSMLAVQSIATDKVYGGSPRIDLVCDRGNLRHYSGAYGVGSPTLRPSNNPAWACWDLLTNPVYGCGLSPTKLILSEFTAWANFCISKGIECNAYFDQQMTAFEALGIISTLGYGTIMPRGTNIGCMYEDVSQMVYTFGMGNIIQGSFNMYYVEKQNRANVIELNYFDKDINYDRRILVVRNGETENENDVTAPISLVGCTDREQARKYANRLVRSNMYNLRICEFDADIDAIHCQIGDVIGVSHDVPQYGYSGRTKISTNNTIDLGLKIFLEAAKTYSILVRHDNDVLESKNIASPLVDGDYQVLTLATGTWTTNPEFMSTWNLATVATGIKKFRIVSISKSQDFVAKIKALEYREEILEDGDTIPDFESDTLLESVVGLTAYVNFVKGSDGAIRATINADWRGVSTEWRVNVSRSDGYTKPEWNTYVTRSDFTVENIIPRATDKYRIRVTGLDGDTAEVEVDMIIDPPVQLTGIEVNIIDQFVNVKWTPPFSEAPIKKYDIYRGLDFLNASLVGSSNSNFFSFMEPNLGKNNYWLVAVNEFDGRSIPTAFEATIEGNPNFELQNSFNLLGTGTGDDFYVDGDTILGPIGVTITTWEESVMDLYPVDFATKTMDDLIADYGYTTIIDMLGSTSDGLGSYSEVIDLAVTYPKAEFRLAVEKIKGTMGYGVADADTTFKVSNDGITFYSDVGALNQIGLGVRYVMVNISFLGDGNTAIWIRPRIDVATKTIQQTGKLTISDANAGLTVPLTVGFVDVNGINVTPKATGPRYAVYDFDDVPNPTDFTVWLFDENGTKVTGTFNYIVTGI
jgi:predicted phage tail protein